MVKMLNENVQFRLSELYGKDDKDDREDEQGIPGKHFRDIQG